jgi:hypothetical protein
MALVTRYVVTDYCWAANDLLCFLDLPRRYFTSHGRLDYMDDSLTGLKLIRLDLTNINLGFVHSSMRLPRQCDHGGQDPHIAFHGTQRMFHILEAGELRPGHRAVGASIGVYHTTSFERAVCYGHEIQLGPGRVRWRPVFELHVKCSNVAKSGTTRKPWEYTQPECCADISVLALILVPADAVSSWPQY